MESSATQTQTSLIGRLARAFRKDQPERLASVWQGVIDPLPLVAALEELATRCGKSCPREMLVAALPVAEQDMDPRFAPIALARAGLEARWEKTRPARLSDADFPMLAPMLDGGAVLLLRRGGQGNITLLDASGEKDMPTDLLAAMIAQEMLVCGHVDPENGLGFEEERSFVRRNPRLWLLGTFLSERKRLGQLLVAAVFLNLCALAIPLYMRAVYDRVVPNLAMESLWALSIGVSMVLFFEFLFKHVRGAYVDAIGVRVGQAVQNRAMTAFLHGRIGKREQNVGTLMTALRDVESLALLVPQAIVTFLVDVPFFFAYAALILLIGGWTVAGPVAGAVALMIVGAIAAYAMKLSSKRASKLMQARNNLVVDVAEGLTTIKANQAEGRFMRQWDIVSDHIGISTRTARKWNDLPGSMSGFLVQLVTVMVIVIGVYQIQAGMMTTGAMIAVTMLTGRAMVPVSAAISMVSRGYQSLSQFAGLSGLLSTEPERDISDPALQGKRIRGEIRLAHVDFTYEGASEPSLKDVSLSVEPGERIALIGRSGSGKSTLLQLLSGMIAQGGGTITVDGHAMGQYAASHLRSHIVYCGQDAALFDSSIWDNILLGMSEPAPEIVEQAIRASGIDRFVARSAEGYARKIGLHGCKLSGGQRQSLVLARALIRDPGMLLLDEPTASMDINSEQAVINGLRDAIKGRTLIVATHRMALLDLVDRIIWLDEGKVVADKPRTEILTMLRNQQQSGAGAPAAGSARAA